jgi:hypothetical protein
MPTRLDARRDALDGKLVVAQSPAPQGTYTWYTSAGDQASPLKRGGGQRVKIEFPDTDTVPKTRSVSVQFVEPVFLHDGEITWCDVDQFCADDEFSIYLEFPATAVVENATNEGNCNLVPIGGGANMIVPAAGDGTHDVDLDAAVPLPDSTNGTWTTDRRTGEITPGAPDGHDPYELCTALLDVAADSIYLCRPIVMSSPRGIFEIDAYLVEWIGKNWKVTLEIVKGYQHTADCHVGGFMMLFRYNATESGT